MSETCEHDGCDEERTEEDHPGDWLARFCVEHRWEAIGDLEREAPYRFVDGW